MRPAAAIVAFALLFAARPGFANGADAPIGRWLTEDKLAVIAIGPCGPGLCGQIAGVTLDHADDPVPTDYQGHSQCGLTIIRDAVQDSDGWSARIVDPRDGHVYKAKLEVDDRHRLRLRGYVGIPLFGSTQVWTPYDGPIGTGCRMAGL